MLSLGVLQLSREFMFLRLSNQRIWQTAAGLAMLASALAPVLVQAAEGEIVSVRVASGRTFRGAMDARTTQRRLWLRVDQGGVSVLRPVDREAVIDAQRGEQTLSRDELFSAIDELMSVRPRTARVDAAVRPDSTKGEAVAVAISADDSEVDLGHYSPMPPVQSLQVDATIGSWTWGADSDGIILDVLPLDGEGCLTIAEGTLEVDLFGDQSGSPTRGQDYHLLGHWVVKLEAAQITPNGARFRLPFQAVSPDFRNDLSPFALVHVRLTAPGQGMFDATTGAIRLRRYNGLRDRLQQTTGSRFFPNERTYRGRSEQRDW
jgi:hypothetical protein